MRHYQLDADGWPLLSYARPQPGRDLHHLPAQPSRLHRWDGEQWVEDAAAVAAHWHERIEARADAEIGRGVALTTQDGTTYTVRSGTSARSLIAGAGVRAERADREGESVTRKIPTDKGVVLLGVADLVTLFDATDARHQAVMDRVETLEAKVADGTMTESDLDSGWP